MSTGRRALVVATYDYVDAGLSRLTAPGRDAESFASVLRDPAMAAFDVTMLLNEPNHVVAEAVEDFYAESRSQDLSLLYFSGHGLKDDDGRLYLAMANTRRARLRSTGLAAAQVNEAMDSSVSRRNVLILDCCYSGAFPPGRNAKADEGVDTLERFHGKGRAVLTASDATQYAFEGDDVRGTGVSSVFTRYLVEAIRTGAADLDEDGDIALDELYRYVRDRVIAEVPQQRPKKQEDVDGRILIARNVHWTLPLHVRHAIDSPDAVQRLHALSRLEHLHRVGNDHVKAAVRGEVAALTDDDSRKVSAAAAQLLERMAADGEPTVDAAAVERDRRAAAEREAAKREVAAREAAKREAAAREAAEREAAERTAAERARIEAEQRMAAEAVWQAEQIQARARARLEAAEREAADRERRKAEDAARREAAERERRDRLRREAEDAARREETEREAAERQARWEAREKETQVRLRREAQQAPAGTATAHEARSPIDRPTLGLAVGGLALVVVSRAFDFETGYGYSASGLGWTAPVLGLGVVLPLAVAGLLLALRGDDARAVALGRGLVVGAALSLTHHIAVVGVRLFEPYLSYEPGPGFWLLVLGWGLVVAAARLALTAPTTGTRSAAPLGLRIACAVVVAGMGVGLAVAEGTSGFQVGESRLDWVVPVAVALLVTLVRLTDSQRITVLTAVVVLATWLAYFPLRALVLGWEADPTRSYVALAFGFVGLAACFVAQRGSRARRRDASEAGAGRR